MIVADRFVYIHLHKTGGSFVNDFLLRHIPGARHVGYHLPRRLAPPAARDLPVIGFVRNPWSFYVSWYFFQARKQNPNPLFGILSQQGRLDFAATLRNLLDLGVGGRYLDQLCAALPSGYSNRGLNLPGFELAGIRGAGSGFYTFLYRHLYGGPGVSHIRKLEHLREDFGSMLVAVGQPVSAAMREHVLSAPALNESQHANYREYYSSELRLLVAERDAELIERYGYRFGG